MSRASAPMYDTVHLWARLLDPGRLVARLEGATPTTAGRPGIRGTLGAVRVTVYADCASVRFEVPTIAGVASPSPRQTAAAIAAVEEAVGERLAGASVSRLDVFADLPLSRPVRDYLPLLAWTQRRERVAYPEDAPPEALQTVAFKAYGHCLQYYDRVARLLSRGIDAAGDLLRVESQHRRTVPHQFGGRVHPADLSCSAFRARCAARWKGAHDGVLSLPALRPFAAGMDPQRHASLALLLREPDAFGAYGAALDAGAEGGVITRDQRDREKAKLRALLRDPEYAAPHPLRSELDAAVADAAARMPAGSA